MPSLAKDSVHLRDTDAESSLSLSRRSSLFVLFSHSSLLLSLFLVSLSLFPLSSLSLSLLFSLSFLSFFLVSLLYLSRFPLSSLFSFFVCLPSLFSLSPSLNSSSFHSVSVSPLFVLSLSFLLSALFRSNLSVSLLSLLSPLSLIFLCPFSLSSV